MFKYTVLAILVFALTACGGPGEPVDIQGHWQTDEDAGATMYAEIVNGQIEIVWVTDGIQGLYWQGSAPEVASAGETFVSEGNTEAMNNSLLGSTVDTKEFTYASDAISFDLTVAGVTQTLYLKRS